MNNCFKETNCMAKKEYEFDNTYLVDEFINYPLYGMVCDDYPWIDDIIVGCANLDLGGNTRPLSVVMLYTLISTQKTIKTSLIMDATGYSLSYCQKLAGVLRVACRALEKELRKQDRISTSRGIWYAD